MKILARIKTVLKKKIYKSIEITESMYFFGDYKILLRSNHTLDKYQKSFPLYDRFLPLLCVSFEGLIIDIGANIGDTSVAIFSKNKKCFIVGVEPDSTFYSDCIFNIQQNNLTNRFMGVNKFLSTYKGLFSVVKNKTLSTGSISHDIEQTGQINTISFLELMNSIPLEKTMKFDLLKIDTDGFDWDILDSFAEYNKSFGIKPRFIFFEMQTYLNNLGVNDENRNITIEKYKLSIEQLQKIGYNNFCLFDNFGTPIKVTKSIIEIFELNDYIKKSQILNSNSTIYYMDVLAFLDNELNLVDESISNLYKTYKV